MDFESKLAYVEYDQDKVNFDLITETVTKTGSGDIYSVTGLKKVNNSTQPISCIRTAVKVRQRLKKQSAKKHAVRIKK